MKRKAIDPNRRVKALIIIALTATFLSLAAAGAYLIPRYGLAGSYYAIRAKIQSYAGSMLVSPTVSAGSDTDPLSTSGFDYQVIDTSIAGDCKMAGDIDGDGFADLIIGGAPNEKLNWYRYPNWDKTVIATPGIEFTTDGALGDVDGDGDLDIIIPDGDQGNNLLWFKNPRPTGDPANGSQWARMTIGTINSWGKDVKPADYDRNGFLDVATRSENEAMIFFQTGANQWKKVVFSGLNTGQEGMAMGDIDGDGNIDLVLQGVWVRNPGGNAAQTASNWIEYTIGDANPAFKALVIDLNQDGKQDVLFSSSENTADVNWWTPVNAPTGAWVQHTILPMEERAHTLQAADMDQDGDIDVVVGQMHTSQTQEILIMTNLDGKATSWEKRLVGTGGLHNGVVADIGNDGDYDIFGANWTGNPPVKLWINQGQAATWAFKQVSQANALTFGLAFGDMNNDGKKDIVSGQYWYQNPGGDLMGAWEQFPFPSGMQVDLSLDVDDDEYADVIAQKEEDALSVYWLEATNTAGTAWNAVKIGSLPKTEHTLGSQGYRVAQIEAGGKPEVVMASGTGHGNANEGIYYFRIPANPENGNWPRVHVNGNPSDEGLAVGDIDRDGDLDIAASTGESKRIEWYQNPGDGTAEWQAFVVGAFSDSDTWPDRTEVADFNGDGRLDIITTEENGAASGAETYWWEQPANPASPDWPRHLVTSQGSTNSMDAGDVDQDGDIDIVLGEHRGELRLSLWRNDGLGRFTGSLIDAGKESHLGAQLEDLNGDGRLDVISIAYDTPGNVLLWINNNPVVSTPTPLQPAVFIPLILQQLLSDAAPQRIDNTPTAQVQATDSAEVSPTIENLIPVTSAPSQGHFFEIGNLLWIGAAIFGALGLRFLIFRLRKHQK